MNMAGKDRDNERALTVNNKEIKGGKTDTQAPYHRTQANSFSDFQYK